MDVSMCSLFKMFGIYIVREISWIVRSVVCIVQLIRVLTRWHFSAITRSGSRVTVTFDSLNIQSLDVTLRNSLVEIVWVVRSEKNRTTQLE